MRSKPLILTALLLAAFLVSLDTTLVNVALPALTRELHASTTQLQWVVDAYNLVFAALLLTFGSLSDRFGRKGMLLAGLAVVGAASLAGGFTTSAAQLIAARAVMGLGAAMAFPATLSLLTNVFTERRERARAIGLWGAVAGVAIALGPIVGGWLLAHFSWGSVFVAMAPVAALALAGAAVAVPAARSADAPRPDVPGLVLSSATMAVLVFTIIEAPASGWTAARSLAGFAVAAAGLAAFIAAERRAPHPMLDLRIFRDRRFSAASGAVTVSFFTLLGFIFLITQYFQFVRGYSALSAGVRLLPVAVAVAAGSIIGTQLAVRAGTKLVVTTGLVASAAFYAWVAATTSATLSYGVIAAQMVVYGLGTGLTSGPATESIMGAISRSRAGVGSAVNDATRLIGGTLGVAVIGSVYASVYGARLTATTPPGVPGPVAALAHQSVGAAYAAAGGVASLGHPVLGQALRLAATNAFLHGLVIGALVAGGVAAAGAVLTALFLPAQPAQPAQRPLPAEAAQPPQPAQLSRPAQLSQPARLAQATRPAQAASPLSTPRPTQPGPSPAAADGAAPVAPARPDAGG
jgi:EmrB/QacA subfamily drug resistance transporter